jgi:hypothetical protein
MRFQQFLHDWLAGGEGGLDVVRVGTQMPYRAQESLRQPRYAERRRQMHQRAVGGADEGCWIVAVRVEAGEPSRDAVDIEAPDLLPPQCLDHSGKRVEPFSRPTRKQVGERQHSVHGGRTGEAVEFPALEESAERAGHAGGTVEARDPGW